MVQRQKNSCPYWADFDSLPVTASSGRQRWWQYDLSRPSLLWTSFTITHSSALLIKQTVTLMQCILKNTCKHKVKRISLSPFVPQTPLSLCSNDYWDWHSKWSTVMRCVRKCVSLCVSHDAPWLGTKSFICNLRYLIWFYSDSRHKNRCSNDASSKSKLQRDTAVKLYPLYHRMIPNT